MQLNQVRKKPKRRELYLVGLAEAAGLADDAGLAELSLADGAGVEVKTGIAAPSTTTRSRTE
jgi:hypothetical protein